ncbi:hypothetical protein L9F63_007562, partial [Diploptera punctata]
LTIKPLWHHISFLSYSRVYICPQKQFLESVNGSGLHVLRTILESVNMAVCHYNGLQLSSEQFLASVNMAAGLQLCSKQFLESVNMAAGLQLSSKQLLESLWNTTSSVLFSIAGLQLSSQQFLECVNMAGADKHCPEKYEDQNYMGEALINNENCTREKLESSQELKKKTVRDV